MAVKQTAGRNQLGVVAPKFAELNDDVLFGEVWAREDKLSPKMRSLVTVVTLVAKGIFDSSFEHHMTTAKNNGGLNMFSDPYISRAQIYASASSPRGPFVENKEDNVLFGGQYSSGYSARTIMFRDQLRMMYTDSNGGNSVLSLPKTVGLNEDGYLRLFYASDLLDVLRTGSLTTNILAQPSTSFAWNTHGGVWTKSGNSMSITTDPYSWQAAIFDSISKNNYSSAYSGSQLMQASKTGIIDRKVIALGGIQSNNIRHVKELGFGGAAVLGDIWNRFDSFNTVSYKSIIDHFKKLKKLAE